MIMASMMALIPDLLRGIELIYNNGGSTGTYVSATISDGGQSGALVLLALYDKSQSTNFICSYLLILLWMEH